MHGDEGVAACGRGADFQAAGVAGDEHCAVLFDEVFCRGEGDSGGVVFTDFGVVVAVGAPVAEGAGADEDDVSRLKF